LGYVGAAARWGFDCADVVVFLLVVVLVVFGGRRGEVRAAARGVGHDGVVVVRLGCWVLAGCYCNVVGWRYERCPAVWVDVGAVGVDYLLLAMRVATTEHAS
jgi:hypothetical protein